MEHPGFFERAGPFPLRTLSEVAGASLANGADPDTAIGDVRPLDVAKRGDISFLDNPKYLTLFTTTEASACLVAPKFASQAPSDMACLVMPDPYHGFAKVLALFYPDALRPMKAVRVGITIDQPIDPTAVLEEGVTVEPGAVIGPESFDRRGHHHRCRHHHWLSRSCGPGLLYRTECHAHQHTYRQSRDCPRRGLGSARMDLALPWGAAAISKSAKLAE